MDTSRGHDGPIDSRDDRQLRSVLGRHIMIWGQTWRQMWRPSKRHHQPIDTTREAQPAWCVADGGLAPSAAGDRRCPLNGSGCSHTGEGSAQTNGAMISAVVSATAFQARPRI
jgi:hypothetical protein